MTIYFIYFVNMYQNSYISSLSQRKVCLVPTYFIIFKFEIVIGKWWTEILIWKINFKKYILICLFLFIYSIYFLRFFFLWLMSNTQQYDMPNSLYHAYSNVFYKYKTNSGKKDFFKFKTCYHKILRYTLMFNIYTYWIFSTNFILDKSYIV